MLISRVFLNRSLSFLTKLERLDLGCNELEDLVSDYNNSVFVGCYPVIVVVGQALSNRDNKEVSESDLSGKLLLYQMNVSYLFLFLLSPLL